MHGVGKLQTGANKGCLGQFVRIQQRGGCGIGDHKRKTPGLGRAFLTIVQSVMRLRFRDVDAISGARSPWRPAIPAGRRSSP